MAMEVIRNVLGGIDPNTMILGLLFVIFFAIINFALGKSLRDKKTSGIIAFCISLLAVYGINRTNFDVSGMFYSIGISEEMIYTILPWIILVGLIFMIWKLKLPLTLMLVGIILIIASFFVYEQTWVLIVGIVLFVLGFLLWLRRKKKGPSTLPGGTNGKDALIKAAKRFYDWAKVQSNPRFAGSYMYFIYYLNGNKKGGSEAQMCQRYGVSRSELVHIFNKYGLVR